MHVKDLRKQVGMRTVADSLCCRRLEWLGHVIRMDGNRLVSRVWGSKCKGVRARGKPRWNYEKQEAKDLAKGSMRREAALDRDRWRALVGKIGIPQ